MGKLIHTLLPNRSRWLWEELMYAMSNEAGQEKEVHNALTDDQNGVLIIVGNKAYLKELERNLPKTLHDPRALSHDKKPAFPPIVHGELPKELGTFRREDLYD
jgi:hypothetical protein